MKEAAWRIFSGSGIFLILLGAFICYLGQGAIGVILLALGCRKMWNFAHFSRGGEGNDGYYQSAYRFVRWQEDK